MDASSRARVTIVVVAIAAAALGAGCARRPVAPPARVAVPEPPEVLASHGIARLRLDTAVNPTNLMPSFAYAGRIGAGPTIRVRPGDRILLDYANDLPTSDYTGNMTNLHFHGLVTSPHPPGDDAIGTMIYPDQHYRYDVLVGTTQEPGLYWYHPHAHGDTNRQVGLGGMSGAIVVEGIARYVPRLAAMPERILVVRDVFDDLGTNTLRDHPGDVPIDRDSTASNVPCAPIFGRHLTLNGAVDPAIPVGDGGAQFVRFLNATGSRTLDLSIPGATLDLIELDGVPLAAYPGSPGHEIVDHLIVPPASRVEFVASHLAPGMTLHTACYDAGPDGDGDPAADLATFVAGSDLRPRTLGDRDRGAPLATGALRRPLPAPAAHRTIVLSETSLNGDTRFAVDGKPYAMGAAPLFTAKSGTVEAWTVVNRSREMHDFHVHQVPFSITSVDGRPPAGPRRWRDTFPVPGARPGRDGTLVASRTEMLVDLRDPVVRGTLLLHCHLLDHEDAGMMASIYVR